MSKTLGADFYNRHSAKVARDLLGKVLVHKTKSGTMSAMIVETEAYRGIDDPGSHAFRKRTKRNEIMFGPPGRAYVYFCYGFHEMLNFVTEKQGIAGAVLIRAVEPVTGIAIMQKNRNVKVQDLTNGPGKLTAALAIDRKLNGADIISGALIVKDAGCKDFKVCAGPRIGIKQGLEKKWRFYIKGNNFVSA